MALEIDTSEPLLDANQLKELVQAVHGAGEYDEKYWIEWKSRLDLRKRSGVVHVARTVIGFANRDPATALRWAGGYAYMLVGVEPGRLDGVDAVDLATLFPQVQTYVGRDVRWVPEYVEIEGKTVLVAVVDPPRLGDCIHCFHKEYSEVISARNVLVLELGQDECCFPDVADRVRAGSHVSDGGPAGLQQCEASFALSA